MLAAVVVELITEAQEEQAALEVEALDLLYLQPQELQELLIQVAAAVEEDNHHQMVMAVTADQV